MGQAVAITGTEHRAVELQEFAAKSRDAAQVRRLVAMALILDGRSRVEAAKQSGMDRQTLRDWVHRYSEQGVAGLVSRVAPGPTLLLNEQQMAELKVLVVAGPDPEKDGIVRCRCLDLQEQIAQRFSVRFHERSVGKLLHRLGLTRLQSRPYHPNKDAEAQQAFRQTLPTEPPRNCRPQSRANRSKYGSAMKPGWARKAR